MFWDSKDTFIIAISMSIIVESVSKLIEEIYILGTIIIEKTYAYSLV